MQAVAVDIAGAFDKVSHAGVLYKAHQQWQLGIGVYCSHGFNTHYLQCRTIKARVHNFLISHKSSQ